MILRLGLLTGLYLATSIVHASEAERFDAARWLQGCLTLASQDFGFHRLTLEGDCLSIALSYCEFDGFEDEVLVTCYARMQAVLEDEAERLLKGMDLPDDLSDITRLRVDQLIARNQTAPEVIDCTAEAVNCAFDSLKAAYDRRSDLALAARLIAEAQN